MNVWNPHVQEQNEFSLAQFWLAAADNNGVNRDTIEGGVMVYIISSISFSFRRMQNIELLIISNFYKIICVEKQVYYEMNRDYRTRLFTFWTVRVSIFDFPASTSHVYIVSFLKSSFFFFFFFLKSWLQSDSYQTTGCYNLLFSSFVQNNFSFLKSVLYIYIYIYYHGCRIMDTKAVATICNALALFKPTTGLPLGQPSSLIPIMVVTKVQSTSLSLR